jgi:hypothetical protein
VFADCVENNTTTDDTQDSHLLFRSSDLHPRASLSTMTPRCMTIVDMFSDPNPPAPIAPSWIVLAFAAVIWHIYYYLCGAKGPALLGTMKQI